MVIVNLSLSFTPNPKMRNSKKGYINDKYCINERLKERKIAMVTKLYFYYIN